MPAGNAKFLMDSVFELSQRINTFKLADAEIGLFSSVVIIAAGKRPPLGESENLEFNLFLSRPARTA